MLGGAPFKHHTHHHPPPCKLPFFDAKLMSGSKREVKLGTKVNVSQCGGHHISKCLGWDEKHPTHAAGQSFILPRNAHPKLGGRGVESNRLTCAGILLRSIYAPTATKFDHPRLPCTGMNRKTALTVWNGGGSRKFWSHFT